MKRMWDSVRPMARRVYAEIVRRPTTKIALAEGDAEWTAPIFILGEFRSGTTLLRYVLDSHPRIACPPESEFLASLGALLGDERSMSGLAFMGYDREHVVARVRSFAGYFFANYASAAGKVRCADKSPRYLAHLDLLAEIFPTARYLCLYRHGLDVAHSLSKGGTSLDFHPDLQAMHRPGEDYRVTAVRFWQSRVRKQLDFEARNAQCTTRVMYERLCDHPEAALRLMFEFLGEPWSPNVLRFNEARHDFGLEDDRVKHTRGFERLSHRFHEWPKSVLEESWAIAGIELHELGYEPSRTS